MERGSHGTRSSNKDARISRGPCPYTSSTLSSLRWHAANGFVGNLRSAEAYVWDGDEGLVGQFFYNDDAQSTLSTERTVQVVNA